MLRFFCLSVLLPAVLLARVPYVEHYEVEDAKEIAALVALTNSLEESGKLPVLSSALTVTEDQVSFYVYNKNDHNSKEVLFTQATSIDSLSDFDVSLPTVFIIHGWHNTYDSSFPISLGTKYQSVTEINIISVNWDETAQADYLEAASAASTIGQYIGQFIKNLSSAYDYSLDNISIVGHSLGAQIAGFAGKETNGTLHSITGLDPAGPLFFLINPTGRLSKGDAQYIQAIHTNAGLLGVNYDIGDSDFWPNGGQSQPGCDHDSSGSCSHARSYQYFIESLSSNDFVAKACDSYDHYTEGVCKTSQSVVMGGLTIDNGVEGNYYLETNSESPYALGDN